MRLAFDALNPSRIPITAEMVLGYDAWTEEEWALFRSAVQIRIAQHPDQVGKQYSILDVERYDAAIADAPGWIKEQQRMEAAYNTIYVQKSNLAELRAKCRGLHYYLIVAWWTDTPTRIPGTVGHQYAGNVAQGAYDLTAIYDPKWHPSPRRPR